MESANDKLRAFALALAIHLLCIGAILAGLWWTHATQPVTMPGPVIEATLVGPTAAPKRHSGKTSPRPAPPKPAPPKPAPPKPPAKTEPPPTDMQHDRIERERIAALAAQQAEQEKKEQEERHRQAQVLLEQQEKERKLAEQRQKQIADIRRQREAVEKKLALEQQRLAQLEDRHRAEEPQAGTEAPQPQTGAGGKDDDLSARYAAAIQAAVTQNWNRPESAQAGLHCVLRITQIPGGDVISATVSSPCNADQATRNSIEQAVMKAAPLPYQGYEKVFQRGIDFNFKYDG
ncbi:MAG: cell envelope integrity protein TolA [Rhodanobacteraceae bacterium]